MRFPRAAWCAAMSWAVALLTSAAHAAPSSVPFEETVGVNTHYGAGREPVSAAALERLSAAGVSFVRNDLDWASIERAPGVYDFAGTGVDDLVEAAEQNGLSILFILDYGNSLYGPAQAVVSEEGRAAFAAYAAAAAGRYGGRGHLWEIWNEPNLPQFWNGDGARPNPEQYALLVDAAVAALREADPSATVLAGATFMGLPTIVPLIGGVEGGEFLERAFAAGLLDRVDGVTAHFYRAESPESVVVTVERIRALMAAAGRTLPLWSGEWGYSTYDPQAPPTGVNYLPAVSEARQASYAARMLLTNYALGLAGSVWFKDRDAPQPSPGNIEHHFGLMHDDLAPKGAYEAVATVTRLLAGFSLATELPLPAGEHGLVFANGKQRITALWAENRTLWRLAPQAPETLLIARDGRDVTPVGWENGLQIRISSDDGPMYIVGDVAVLAPSLCAGDCRGDGSVSIDELTSAVGIVLRTLPALQCVAADTNDDGEVTIGELVVAVRRALEGC